MHDGIKILSPYIAGYVPLGKCLNYLAIHNNTNEHLYNNYSGIPKSFCNMSKLNLIRRHK